MQAPKISVIIPVYNGEKYLKACIDSIINQRYKDLEVIIVNDGSQDKTREICNAYLEKDKRIRLINKNNGGVSSARNKGIEVANGEYIIFLDSDDWVEKDFFEKINYIHNKNIDLFIYGINKINKSSRNRKIEEGGRFLNLQTDIVEMIKSENINSPVNKIYKREIIIKNNILFYTELNLAEDFVFNIEYILCVSNIYKINDKIYNYRINQSNSLTTKYIDNKYQQLIQANNYAMKAIKNNKKFNSQITEQIIEILKWIRIKNILSSFRELHRKECEYSIKEKIEFIKNVIYIEEKNNIFLINNNKLKNKEYIVKKILESKNFILIYIFSWIMYIIKKSKKGN